MYTPAQLAHHDQGTPRQQQLGQHASDFEFDCTASTVEPEPSRRVCRRWQVPGKIQETTVQGWSGLGDIDGISVAMADSPGKARA